MNLYNIIKKIHNICYRKPKNLINRYYNLVFRFILPNLQPLLFKNLKISNRITIQQIVLCQGQGTVYIGKNCILGFKLGGFWRGGSIELQARYKSSVIRFGNNIATNNNIMLCAANYIEIGNNTLIGQYVTIMDFDAHGVKPENRKNIGEIGKVIIGDNCWIGNNVTILKNSEVGNNTIIATGAVVNGKFPENVIIGGVPAKIIKSLK